MERGRGVTSRTSVHGTDGFRGSAERRITCVGATISLVAINLLKSADLAPLYMPCLYKACRVART